MKRQNFDGADMSFMTSQNESVFAGGMARAAAFGCLDFDLRSGFKTPAASKTKPQKKTATKTV